MVDFQILATDETIDGILRPRIWWISSSSVSLLELVRAYTLPNCKSEGLGRAHELGGGTSLRLYSNVVFCYRISRREVKLLNIDLNRSLWGSD